VTVRRLGTGPELLVCGKLAESCELYHGDRIEFGPFELRVHIAANQNPDFESTVPANELSFCDEVESLLHDIRRGLAEDLPLSLSRTASPASA
jgi:hypothetical protein